jgi:hypothetical protein
MDQLGRLGGGPGGEIVLLAKKDFEAAAGGVARETGAIDPAANDREIVKRAQSPSSRRWLDWR